MGSQWSTLPDWRLFELVAANTFRRSLDPGAAVTSPQRVRGLESRYSQEIDGLIIGIANGSPKFIVAECKHHRRPVGISIVNAFIGKLMDIGADEGVLFSASGFTKPALARAAGSRVPKVQTKWLPFTTLPSTRVSGPFIWRLGDTTAGPSTRDNWVDIPRQPIRDLGIFSHNARGVLVVENPATFEQVSTNRAVTDRWLCVHGAGYLSSDVAEFLSHFDLLPLVAWFDQDADGLRMAHELAERTGRGIQPVGMSADLWHATPKRPEAPDQLRRSRQIAEVLAADLRGPLQQLAYAIGETGDGCDQEQSHGQVLPSLPEELRAFE